MAPALQFALVNTVLRPATFELLLLSDKLFLNGVSNEYRAAVLARNGVNALPHTFWQADLCCFHSERWASHASACNRLCHLSQIYLLSDNAYGHVTGKP
jgi:hypothetical protein